MYTVPALARLYARSARTSTPPRPRGKRPATVLALRRANPRQRFAELYRSGADVGRDHLGATVNTLVFAYAGASLPLLLIFSSQDIGFSDAVNREIVATEIVATLVASIGLVAAVPLTTATAALRRCDYRSRCCHSTTTPTAIRIT